MAWRSTRRAYRLTRADFSRALRGLHGASRELALLRYHARQGRHRLRRRSALHAFGAASVREWCTILACPPLLFLRFRTHRRRIEWLAQIPLEGCAPRPEPLENQIEERGPAIAIRSRGEIDLFSEPLFRKDLLGAVRGTRRPVMLDLREVTYLDGSGLRVLDECRVLSRQNRQPLVVIVGRNVRRIIEIVGLDKSLALADNEERAMELLRSESNRV